MGSGENKALLVSDWLKLQCSDSVSFQTRMYLQYRPLICFLPPSQSRPSDICIAVSSSRPSILPPPPPHLLLTSSWVNSDEAAGPTPQWSEINQPFNPSIKDHYPSHQACRPLCGRICTRFTPRFSATAC